MKRKEKNEMVAKENGAVAASNPQALLAMAVQQNLDVEKLEKLMELQEKWDRQQAKKAFNEAMAKFQSECPVLKKDKSVFVGGQERYKYTPLDSIISQTKGLIAANGFSYFIETADEVRERDGKKKAGINIIVEVVHASGHSKKTTLWIPIEHKLSSQGKPLMSAPQEYGAALTFGKRYAFCNAFGILTGDDDNDGQIGKNAENKPKTVSFPQNGTNTQKSAEKPASEAGAAGNGVIFKVSGKTVSRKKYIDVICKYAEKNGIEISRIISEQKVDKDFVDMENSEVLTVGRAVSAEVKAQKAAVAGE